MYLDTADDSLRKRGVTLRFRFRDDDTRWLSLVIAGAGGNERFDAETSRLEPLAALEESNAVSRRVLALVDPRQLQPRLEIETDRTSRQTDRDWLRRARLEVQCDRSVARLADRSMTFFQVCIKERKPTGLGAKVAGALEQIHALRPLPPHARQRVEEILRWKRGNGIEPDAPDIAAGETPGGGEGPINPELSLLEFQSRVLSLAENVTTPLGERLRFLSIVSSNLDEFFMVRVAGLKQAQRELAEDGADERLLPRDQLRLIARATEKLVAREARCAGDCVRALAAAGVHLLRWTQLTPSQQQELRETVMSDMHPDLTPMAMTMSPGHPLPHLPHLTLALAVVRRNRETGRLHLSELDLPDDSPRFIGVPGTTSSFVALEDVVRSHIDLVYAAGDAESCHVFRVTRSGVLALDEEGADDLIEAVESAAGRRTSNPAVRIEVERDMPHFVREMLLTNLRREDPTTDLEIEDIQDVEGLLDLRCLSALDLPDDPLPRYPQFKPRDPLAACDSMLDLVARQELLFHHPFDSFDATVARFLREASEDADVTTIRITLYRLGASSSVAESLIAAARNGKQVVAFVELKARFDEDHNVKWARKLEKAGGHVVSGLVGFKNHAKVALVVRRRNGRLTSAVHIGTGNYNARTGREYTDFSLFSSREETVADATDLFNALTGGSAPPAGLAHGSLVSPFQMADTLIAHIDREAANARAGLPAGIVIKVNGISDGDVVSALVRAAADGVDVRLICRGVCTLRAGVPGQSEGVSVIAHVGRFLEHSRVFRFTNGGSPLHYIGSADLRQRNLRRRVELLVPVRSEEQKSHLDEILESYLHDPAAWTLQPGGEYVQRVTGGSRAQVYFASDAVMDSAAGGATATATD